MVHGEMQSFAGENTTTLSSGGSTGALIWITDWNVLIVGLS